MNLPSTLQRLVFDHLDHLTLRSLSNVYPYNRVLREILSQICFVDDGLLNSEETSNRHVTNIVWSSEGKCISIDALILIVDIREMNDGYFVLSCSERVREVVIRHFGQALFGCEIRFPTTPDWILQRLTLKNQWVVSLSPEQGVKTNMSSFLSREYEGIIIHELPINHLILDNCSLFVSNDVEEYFIETLSWCEDVIISQLGWHTWEGDDFIFETEERFYEEVIPALLDLFPEMTYDSSRMCDS